MSLSSFLRANEAFFQVQEGKVQLLEDDIRNVQTQLQNLAQNIGWAEATTTARPNRARGRSSSVVVGMKGVPKRDQSQIGSLHDFNELPDSPFASSYRASSSPIYSDSDSKPPFPSANDSSTLPTQLNISKVKEQQRMDSHYTDADEDDEDTVSVIGRRSSRSVRNSSRASTQRSLTRRSSAGVKPNSTGVKPQTQRSQKDQTDEVQQSQSEPKKQSKKPPIRNLRPKSSSRISARSTMNPSFSDDESDVQSPAKLRWRRAIAKIKSMVRFKNATNVFNDVMPQELTIVNRVQKLERSLFFQDQSLKQLRKPRKLISRIEQIAALVDTHGEMLSKTRDRVNDCEMQMNKPSSARSTSSVVNEILDSKISDVDKKMLELGNRLNGFEDQIVELNNVIAESTPQTNNENRRVSVRPDPGMIRKIEELSQKFEKLNQQIEEHDQRLAEPPLSARTYSSRLDAIEDQLQDRVNQIMEQMGTLSTRVEDTQQQVIDATTSMSPLSSPKNDVDNSTRSSIMSIDHRVTNQISDLDKKIEELSAKIESDNKAKEEEESADSSALRVRQTSILDQIETDAANNKVELEKALHHLTESQKDTEAQQDLMKKRMAEMELSFQNRELALERKRKLMEAEEEKLGKLIARLGPLAALSQSQLDTLIQNVDNPVIDSAADRKYVDAGMGRVQRQVYGLMDDVEEIRRLLRLNSHRVRRAVQRDELDDAIGNVNERLDKNIPTKRDLAMGIDYIRNQLANKANKAELDSALHAVQREVEKIEGEEAPQDDKLHDLAATLENKADREELRQLLEEAQARSVVMADAAAGVTHCLSCAQPILPGGGVVPSTQLPTTPMKSIGFSLARDDRPHGNAHEVAQENRLHERLKNRSRKWANQIPRNTNSTTVLPQVTRKQAPINSVPIMVQLNSAQAAVARSRSMADIPTYGAPHLKSSPTSTIRPKSINSNKGRSYL
eukprot:TRINITY_DN8909_c0_g1_i1.p1 TRINITY_DN8909_c0_g1~~TRINITY_DN8909_c0_g1_i1.p1  ORF type:complete len:958 (-),score=274.80 TRINITY_DN8909_c0_g1_i1:1104-3977(-)